MPRPNWFLAFPFDGRFVLELLALPPSFRLFHPDDVHLTLSFLGGCGESAAERAFAAVDAVLREKPLAGVRVSLGEVVPMGPKREYSALSALLDGGQSEMTERLAALRDVASEAALGRREKRAPQTARDRGPTAATRHRRRASRRPRLGSGARFERGRGRLGSARALHVERRQPPRAVISHRGRAAARRARPSRARVIEAGR